MQGRESVKASPGELDAQRPRRARERDTSRLEVLQCDDALDGIGLREAEIACRAGQLVQWRDLVEEADFAAVEAHTAEILAMRTEPALDAHLVGQPVATAVRAVGQPEADLGGGSVDDLHRLDLVDHHARVAGAERCAQPRGRDALRGQREGIGACRIIRARHAGTPPRDVGSTSTDPGAEVHLSSPPKARACSTTAGPLLRCRLRRGNSGAEGAAPPARWLLAAFGLQQRSNDRRRQRGCLEGNSPLATGRLRNVPGRAVVGMTTLAKEA